MMLEIPLLRQKIADRPPFRCRKTSESVYHPMANPRVASGSVFHEYVTLMNGLTVDNCAQEYFPAELDQQHLAPYRDLLGKLATLGAELVPVSLPSTQYALSAYYVIASAEASSCLARYDGIQYGECRS
jgi:hypothetical protein